MKTNISSLDFEQLVAAEKAATTVRRTYEDKMIMFRGVDYNDMHGAEKEEYLELSQKLAQVNAIRLKIINEMEKKLLKLDYDD